MRLNVSSGVQNQPSAQVNVGRPVGGCHCSLAPMLLTEDRLLLTAKARCLVSSVRACSDTNIRRSGHLELEGPASMHWAFLRLNGCAGIALM
jgi:hypothetical protein